MMRLMSASDKGDLDTGKDGLLIPADLGAPAVKTSHHYKKNPRRGLAKVHGQQARVHQAVEGWANPHWQVGRIR